MITSNESRPMNLTEMAYLKIVDDVTLLVVTLTIDETFLLPSNMQKNIGLILFRFSQVSYHAHPRAGKECC